MDAELGHRLLVEHAELMARQGIASRRYEAWVTGFKAIQGTIRKRIFGSFASVLGDKSIEWMTQANLEHLPSFASDQGVALIASERQLDTAAGEAVSSIAARAPYWLQLARFSGSGLGVLLGLHFSGFDGAVLVQQNGLALSLALPLPPFVLGQSWDPTPNLVITPCSPLVAALTSSVTPTRSIPAGTPWFAFDSNTDFCSRFAVIFAGTLPSSFMTSGVATFTGTEDGSTAHPWPTVTWNNQFGDLTYKIQPGAVTLVDGLGPIVVSADTRTKTTTGVQIMASASFIGSVDALAWQAGANPYTDLHPADLARLQTTVSKWKPAKGTCWGLFSIVGGEMWDYPPGLTWDGDSNTWDSGGSVVQISGSF